MKSIIQETKECFFTGCQTDLQEHHIFRGSNRNNSEKYGLKVWLIRVLHDPAIKGSVHADPKGELNMSLLRTGQHAFEENYGTREDFMRIFGRNYL